MSDTPKPETAEPANTLGLSGFSGVNRIGGVATRMPPTENEGNTFQPPSKIDLKEQEARTARTLTFVVVAMLGISIALQYGTMGLLIVYNKSDAIPNFEHLFNAVLPVLAGLTGSAVTYYLTKEKK
jgi:hypothetical protein